jgi:Spy/CpxP family protein refolding chaperone
MPRRLSRFFLSLLPGLLVAFGALAQTAPVPAPDHPGHFHRLRRCLAILDLSDDQKASIQAILDGAQPTLQADAEAVRLARQRLHADASAVPPDACLIGNDFLALRAAADTLHAELDAVRSQIMEQLSPEQQTKLEGCLQAPRYAPASPTDAGPATDAPPMRGPGRMN